MSNSYSGRNSRVDAAYGDKSTLIPGCKEFTDSEKVFIHESEKWLLNISSFYLEMTKKFFLWQYLATISGLSAATLTGASILVISLKGMSAAKL